MDTKCPACGWITLSLGDINTEADPPFCRWAWGWVPHPLKQLLPRSPNRCKPGGMRIDEPRQRTEWTGEASLRTSWLEPACSTKMMMMMVTYHLTVCTWIQFQHHNFQTVGNLREILQWLYMIWFIFFWSSCLPIRQYFAAQCLLCNPDNKTNFGTSFLAVPTLYFCNMIGGVRSAKMHIQRRYYKYIHSQSDSMDNYNIKKVNLWRRNYFF